MVPLIRMRPKWEGSRNLDNGAQQDAEAERDVLCSALLRGGANGASQLVQQMANEGRSMRSIYLDCLSPAIEQLGVLWDRDQVTFLDVSVATVRVREIIRLLGNPPKESIQPTAPKAVFATLPGDVHDVGIRIAAQLQRSKGWNIDLVFPRSTKELIATLARSQAGILGLSIGSRRLLPNLEQVVSSVCRQWSDTRILVSGPAVAHCQEQLMETGIDACAATFVQAERLLAGFSRQMN